MDNFNIERTTEFLTGRLAQRGLPEVGMSEENTRAIKDAVKEGGGKTYWRFLCPPNYVIDENGKIVGPDIKPTMKTLIDNTPMEDYLFRFIESTGVRANMIYVLDDFEKIVYTDPSLQKNRNIRKILENNKVFFNGLKDKVVKTRNRMTYTDLSPRLFLFSDQLEFEDFRKIFEDVQSLIPDEKLVLDVQKYLTDKYPYLLKDEKVLRERALRKIFQYAAEMRVIRKMLPKGSIYMGTEFPIYNVDRMIGIEKKVPTVFCTKDSKLKPYGGAL